MNSTPEELRAQEATILDRQLNGLSSTQAKNATIFTYAGPLDILIMVISCLAAVVAGALNPLLTVIYGNLVGAFQSFSNGSTPGSDLNSSVSKYTLYFVYLAIGEFVFIYVATVGFYYSGERIVQRLKNAYLQAVLRQNMAFFDVLSAGEITSAISSDMTLINEGITSKLSLALTATATFITAIIIVFVEYWRLALILISVIIAMSITGYIGAKYAIRYTRRSMDFYKNGATIAEEAIASIRHVTAFGIQDELASRYLKYIVNSQNSGVKAGAVVALVIAIMHGLPYLSYGLSFWQGSRYVVAGQMSGEAVVTATLATVIGALAIGRVTPNAQAFASSVASSSGILKTISRQSSEDPLSSSGLKPGATEGHIAFKDVKLVYPSRRNVTVLDDLSIDIPAGKTTAIVGSSGCGKSSIFSMIERFYEPVEGHITLDGHDIRDLNLRWLRRQIAYVGQEPILFNTTILENIGYGLSKTSNMPSKEELHSLVTAAAKSANAHEFIMTLPERYDTEVGENGIQLSGGQRQRISIARALIGEPRILLLDEATSALDSKSEKAVQDALDSASNVKGRTTIIIAHRLSTIRDAHKIIVMSNGRIIEDGQHDGLMMQNGVYASMVKKQQTSFSTRTDERISLNEDTPDKINTLSVDYKEFVDDATGIAQHEVSPTIGGKAIGAPTLWGLLKLMSELTKPERPVIFLGLLCSIFVGLGTPVQSVFFAKLIDALSLPSSSYGLLRKRTDFWSLMYLMLGIVAFSARLAQGLCFSYVSQKLTRRARDQAFRSILRQDVIFFDVKEHSTGSLTAFLSTETTHLNSLSGAILGSILSFTATILSGIILSLAIGWKLALVCTATIPVVFACGWVRLKILAVFDDKMKTTHVKSAAYASEAVNAIQTVASLSLEEQMLRHYNSILSSDAAKSLPSILSASSLYAASQSVVFLCAALGFWYGGTLIASGEYTMLQLFICFAALISGSQSAGVIFSFAPDISKAMRAGRDLKALLETRPSIDTWESSGVRTDMEKRDSHIEIENISFRYPARPDRLVLDNFSLSIQPGQYIALVGPSGSGKSTIISLLERFFDPVAGQIRVNGEEISKLNINDYRSRIALVSQESTIYQGTIKENIMLGSDTDIPEEAITQACKEANIYDFIMSLPDGFSTLVGTHGSLLSGGQKQRLAIARALLRNPSILLLDEATSALDSASEKPVQDALDTAARSRTTIAVAHRLSTVCNADQICVLDGGRLVEFGTHEELVRRRGVYAEMLELQRMEGSGERVGVDG